MNEEIVENSKAFETIKDKLANEERLLLRLKSFYDDVLDYEDDCTEVEDREAQIVRKAGKIAEKLLENSVDGEEYNLKSFKTYPVESELKFTILDDEEPIKFRLKIEDDGFELEELV